MKTQLSPPVRHIPGLRSLCFAACALLPLATVHGQSDLTWKGPAASPNWNTTTSNTNWTNGNIDTYFIDGDSVFFTAGASNKTVVVDSTGVKPLLMSVSGDDNAGAVIYTFTDGAITGGDLNINNSASVIFANDTTFTGSVALTNADSTLQIGNGGSTGTLNAGTGGIAVGTGTKLIFYRSNNGIDLGDILIDTPVSGGGKMIFRGTNTENQSSYKFTGSSGGFDGSIDITGDARLILEGSVNGANNAITVETGSTVYLDSNYTYSNPLTLAGNGWRESLGQLGALRLGNNADVAGNLTLTGNTRIGVVNSTATISGTIGSGTNFNVEKVGDGTLILTQALATGGTLAITEGTVRISDATFNNALTGTGTLAVERANATDAFAFGGNAGNTFVGTLEMMQGTISLDDANNRAVLANATLKLDTNSGTTITQNREIGGLAMNGGTLSFDVTTIAPNGILTVTNLDATGGGTIRMDVNKPIDTSLFTTENWYNYGTGNSAGQHQLVAATNVTGAGTQLSWKDYQGNDLGSQTRAINNGTENVGTATFGYAGTVDNTGVLLGYTLTQLSADAGKTITLDSTGATGTILNAKLTGSGGFTFSGAQNTSVGNSTSDYTGATAIDTQTVLMLTNNAFGQTSSLNLRNNSIFDMNGKSQTVGRLDGETGTQILLGALTVTNGGDFTGTLSDTGPGSLTLTGGVLTLFGINSTYSGGTTISGGELVLKTSDNPVGTGKIDIKTGGTLTLAASGFSFNNELTGAGKLHIAENAIITRDNGTFTGDIDIDAPKALSLDYNNTDVTLANKFIGPGNVAKIGTKKLTITGANENTGTFFQQEGDVHLASNWAGNYAQTDTAGLLTTADGATISGYANLANVDIAGTDIGTLNVGSLILIDATIKMDLGANNTSDRIASGDIITVMGSNTLDFSRTGYHAGTFTLLTGLNDWDRAMLDTFAISPSFGGSRSHADLRIGDDAKSLQLVVTMGANTKLIWTGNNGGATDGTWYAANATKQNWSSAANGQAPEYFIGGDYVSFTSGTFVGTKEISVSGNVAPAGMEITGGKYIFSGDAIIGKTDNNDGFDKKLRISGTGTTVAFLNEISFANGLEIAAGATANIVGRLTGDIVNRGIARLGNVYGTGATLPDVSQKGDNAWSKVTNNGTIYLLKTQTRFGWGDFANNGHLDFVNAGNKLYVDSLAGTGTVRMDVDALDRTNSDELIVRTGGTVAPGTHQALILTDVTANPNDVTRDTRFTVASYEDGTPLPNGTVSGRVDIGLYTFDVGTSGANGQAVASGYSSAGQVIVNTTGAIATGWFSQLDNLLKRMGELRLDTTGANGDFWLRGYGQQTNADLGIAGMNGFREYQYGADIGADWAFAFDPLNTVAVGAFVGYQGSTRRFRDAYNSKGDTDSVYGGLYATWMHNDGWYADGVLKTQRFHNSYDAHTDRGVFDNYGLGANIEFGKQFTFEDGWFAEPSVQFAYTHIFSESYSTRDSLRVTTGDSDIYRFVGMVRGGKTFEVGEGMLLQPYAKIGVEEQISSGGSIRVADQRFEPTTDGTRGIVGVGMIWQLDAAQQVHLDYEASWGDKYDKPWGINAGYRLRF